MRWSKASQSIFRPELFVAGCERGEFVIELDPETLAAIVGKREDEVRANADRIFAGIAPTPGLSFEPYRNGSAFVHSRA